MIESPVNAIYTFIVIFLFSTQAMALMGRNFKQNDIEKRTCLITLQSKNNKTYHCTGTIAGKHTIKTAAHCLFGDTRIVETSCSWPRSHGQAVEIIKIDTPDKIEPEHFTGELHHRQYDHALLTTKQSLAVSSLKIASENIEQIIEKAQECFISGFGLSDTYKKKTGHLKTVRVSPQQISLENSLIRVNGRYYFELMPGDSGGALACYSHGTWYDLGTASAHDWEHQSYFAPNSTLPFIPQDTSRVTPLLIHKEKSKVSLFQAYNLKPYSQVFVPSKNQYLFNGDITTYTFIPKKIENGVAIGTLTTTGFSSFYLCSENLSCRQEELVAHVSLEDI